MPLYDYACECGFEDEIICPYDEKYQECSECGGPMKRVVRGKCATAITKFIPSYPGAKKHRAGYVHTHADRDATKIQSGYGGVQGPK